MSEQERNDKEPMICLTPKPSKVSLFIVYKAKSLFFFFFFLQKKTFLRKRKKRGLNKKTKRMFLNALVMAIKKDHTTSIRKYANELKVYKKACPAGNTP